MTDPHRHQIKPDLFESEGTRVDRVDTIRLRQTDGEWMTGINGPAERPSIVLAADREAVMAKSQPLIEAHSHARQKYL